MYLNRIKPFLLRLRSIFKSRSSANISSRTFFAPGVQILGIDHVSIKSNCTIGENTCFTVNDRENKDLQLTIGSNVYVGRDCFFSIGKSIAIGDYSIFGNKCSFLCSDHNFNDPLVPYALSGNTFTKSIKIGVNCWLGHDVCVVGNVSIGHGSIIGAKSVITKDIPPFSMVVGNPGKIVKTYDFARKEWLSEKQESESQYYDESIYLNYLIDNSKEVSLLYYSASSKFGDL